MKSQNLRLITETVDPTKHSIADVTLGAPVGTLPAMTSPLSVTGGGTPLRPVREAGSMNLLSGGNGGRAPLPIPSPSRPKGPCGTTVAAMLQQHGVLGSRKPTMHPRAAFDDQAHWASRMPPEVMAVAREAVSYAAPEDGEDDSPTVLNMHRGIFGTPRKDPINVDGIPYEVSRTFTGLDGQSVLTMRGECNDEFPIPVKTGVLAKHMIVRLRSARKLRIEPFFEEQLTNVAYDVRLGECFFVEDTDAPGVVIDVSDKASVRSSWKPGIPTCVEGAFGIMLSPGQMAIAHTHEFIGSMPGVPVTTLLRARSSMVRAGLTVSASGCWGDIGYNNRWAMILKNTRTTSAIFIPFGTRVAQIVFFATTHTMESDSYEQRGQYAHKEATEPAKTFEELIKNWSPKSLL